MKLDPQGSRAAVLGASTLLGQELLTVLEERRFPISSLIKFDTDDEPDVPILDLREGFLAAAADQEVGEQDFDLAFIATNSTSGSSLPQFLRSALPEAGIHAHGGAVATAGTANSHCVIIDLAGSLREGIDRILSVPFLETAGLKPHPNIRQVTPRGKETKIFVSPHPGAILISSLLLRLAARFTVKRAVALLFEPVSEIGPRAIEELQKQAVSLLTFQKPPRDVFGDQLAFNLLPRLGRSSGETLAELEKTLRQQLREYLANRAPLPAVRLIQAPVFHSLALSLYLELAEPESPENIVRALAGKPLHLRRHSQAAPSQVESTGSPDILVDSITPDAEHPAGIWIWAVADNMRLAAVNAVEIAEGLRK